MLLFRNSSVLLDSVFRELAVPFWANEFVSENIIKSISEQSIFMVSNRKVVTVSNSSLAD